MTELGKLVLSVPGKFASFAAGKGLGKLPIFFIVYGFLYRFLRPSGTFLIDAQGSRMYLNSRDVGIAPYLLQWGVYEKHETELFKRLVRRGMVVVDVGANVGYYTLLAARLVGEEGKVFAFEPDPENYDLLCRNILVNEFRNVIAVRKAVSSESGRTELFLDKSNLGGHSLSEENVDKRSNITVEVTSLDDYFEHVDCDIDILKMDVQGLEMKVLEGMVKTLGRNAGLKLITEFWPKGLLNSGSSPEYFLNMLNEHGFSLYRIGQSLEQVGVGELLRSFVDGEIVSLLCTRPKRARATIFPLGK